MNTAINQPVSPSRLEIGARLRQAGLRPTRQRVSLATIYNTLHQFTDAGLLREVAVDGSKTYFDTNTSDHHHFFVEDDNEVFDIPVGVDVTKLPEPPPGYEISRVDVVVRLRRVKSRG